MRKPIVILEGCDKSGKTEIAKELASWLQVPYFKSSTEREGFRSGPDRFINEIRWADPVLNDFLVQANCGAVFDRRHPSEYVYSRYYNRQTDMQAIRSSDEALANAGAVIVIAHRTSYAGFADDIDTKLGPDQLMQLLRLYREFTAITKCPVYFLNVDDEDLDRECAEVVAWLKQQQTRK